MGISRREDCASGVIARRWVRQLCYYYEEGLKWQR